MSEEGSPRRESSGASPSQIPITPSKLPSASSPREGSSPDASSPSGRSLKYPFSADESHEMLQGDVSEAYRRLCKIIADSRGPPSPYSYEAYLLERPYRYIPREIFRVVGDRPGFFEASRRPSTITESALQKKRVEWEIPSDVHIYAPIEGERADCPPTGMVAVNYSMMSSGLRFPIPDSFAHLVQIFGVAPMQLVPNAWATMHDLTVLFGYYGLYRGLTGLELLFLLSICDAGKGDYYLKQRDTIITDLTSKQAKWTEKWFFVAGEWNSKNFPLSVEYRTTSDR